MSTENTPAPPLHDRGGAAGDSPTESSADPYVRFAKPGEHCYPVPESEPKDPFGDPRVMLESMLEATHRMASDMLLGIQGGAGDADPEGYALTLRDAIRILQIAEKDLLANETHTCFKGDT